MPVIVQIEELKKDTVATLKRLEAAGSIAIIEEDGSQLAAIIPMKIYEAMKDQRRERFFKTVDEIRQSVNGYDPEKLEAEIEAAVQEVREERRLARNK